MLSERRRIRPMREADLPQVVVLERLGQPVPWPGWVLRRAFRAGLSCWVLEMSGRVEGFAVMLCKGYTAHLLNLCVHPERRGAGLGRRLLRQLLCEAGRRGMREARLEVRASNRGAIRLYRALGFRRTGLRPRYYHGPRRREHAIVMVCTLPYARAPGRNGSSSTAL